MRIRFVGDNSIANILKQGQAVLESGSDSALLDSQILLCFVLNKPRSYLFTWPDKQLSNQDFEHFLSLLNRRYAGEPIAYIVGEKEFWSLPLKVSPATLIPRPDTETLIELVLDLYQDEKSLTCLDLGTGTGAIALALASEQPNWQIDAIDFSMSAVQLAAENASNLTLNQVNIYQSDWFSAVPKGKKFTLIVSNPPYIDPADENLNQGDVRFEPKSALIADANGLADIKHIAQHATAYLTQNGKLFFEHGFDQGQAVRDILMHLGYKEPKTRQDLNNLDRITWAVLP